MPNVNNAAIVPSSQQAIVTPSGTMTTVLQRFFNALVSSAAPIQTVTLTASPYTYRAGSAGSLAVAGGTVSAITVTRNNTTAATGITAGLIPVANGDLVTIAYSAPPNVQFIPT